jgi:hypothetical protein
MFVLGTAILWCQFWIVGKSEHVQSVKNGNIFSSISSKQQYMETEDDDDDGAVLKERTGIHIDSTPIFYELAARRRKHKPFLGPVDLPLAEQEYISLIVGDPGRNMKFRVNFRADITTSYMDLARESRTFSFSTDIFYIGPYKLRLPVAVIAGGGGASGSGPLEGDGGSDKKDAAEIELDSPKLQISSSIDYSWNGVEAQNVLAGGGNGSSGNGSFSFLLEKLSFYAKHQLPPAGELENKILQEMEQSNLQHRHLRPDAVTARIVRSMRTASYCDGELAFGPGSALWKYWHSIALSSDALILGERDETATDGSGMWRAKNKMWMRAPWIHRFSGPSNHSNISSDSSGAQKILLLGMESWLWKKIPRGATVTRARVNGVWYAVVLDYSSRVSYVPRALLKQSSFHLEFSGSFNVRFSVREHEIELKRDLFHNIALESPFDNVIVLGKRTLSRLCVYLNYLDGTVQFGSTHRLFIESLANFYICWISITLLVAGWLLETSTPLIQEYVQQYTLQIQNYHPSEEETEKEKKSHHTSPQQHHRITKKYPLLQVQESLLKLTFFHLIGAVILALCLAATVEGFSIHHHTIRFLRNETAGIAIVWSLLALGWSACFLVVLLQFPTLARLYGCNGEIGNRKSTNEPKEWLITTVDRWSKNLVMRRATFDTACLISAWLALMRRHYTMIDVAYILGVSFVLAVNQTFWCLVAWNQVRHCRLFLSLCAILTLTFFYWFNIVPAMQTPGRRGHDEWTALDRFVEWVFSTTMVVAPTIYLYVYHRSRIFFRVLSSSSSPLQTGTTS